MGKAPTKEKEKRGDAGRPLTKTNSLNREAEKWGMRQLRKFMEAKSQERTGGGNNAKQIQSVVDVLSGVFMMGGPPPKGVKAAFRRVTGFTKAMLKRGKALKKAGLSSPAELRKGIVCKLKRSPHSFGDRQQRCMLWVYMWFHDECPIVGPDKSRLQKMKGRLAKIKLNGKEVPVVCNRRIADGDKNDLVQSFLVSPAYKQWLVDNPGDELTRSSIQRCICPCISKAKINECSCKICTEFQSALAAWHKQREVWHKEKCQCPGCSDQESFARYRKASKDMSKFRAAVCCPRRDYPHLKLPHQPDIMPQFYKLQCCKETASQPPHVDMCKECGVHNKLYRHPECVEQRAGARKEDKATWKQWVPTQVDASEARGGVQIRDVFREREGTRKDLVDRVFELAPLFLFHMWVHQMTRHMGHLRVATFDGKTTVLVNADFAATVNLPAEHMATCERGRQTNLWVGLVLHSPDTSKVEPGAEREVICDEWRYFTNAKPSTMVHQRVVQDITKHYKEKIPSLESVSLVTDNAASQFKGMKNFFCIAGGNFPPDMYNGVTQTHSFTAPGHGGGPVDNAGKVAKDYCRKASEYRKKLSAYDYDTAYWLVSKGLTHVLDDPDWKRKGVAMRKKSGQGTWACNGERIFGVLSNGLDNVGKKKNHPIVPKFNGDVTAVAGSRRLFGFQQVEHAHMHTHTHTCTHTHTHTHTHTYTGARYC